MDRYDNRAQKVLPLDDDARAIVIRVATWMLRTAPTTEALSKYRLRLILWLHRDDLSTLFDALSAASLKRGCALTKAVTAMRKNRQNAYPELMGAITALTPPACDRVIDVLHERLAVLAAATPPKGSMLERVEQCLDQNLGLNHVSREVYLAFALCETSEHIDFWAHCDLEIIDSRGVARLAALVGASQADVLEAIDGTLIPLNLLHRDRLLQLATRPDQLVDPWSERRKGGWYHLVPASTLSLTETALDPSVREHLLDLLNRDGDVPIHVLFYGPPGSGKTSTARALANAVERRGIEVTTVDGKGSTTRKLALHAALRLRDGDRRPVVVVDEADALLETVIEYMRTGKNQEHTLLNRLLEEPGARVIWVVQRTHAIEASVLRRMVFSQAFEPPDEAGRIDQWGVALARHRITLPRPELQALARHAGVSTGAVELAARSLAHLVDTDPHALAPRLELALAAQGALQNGGEPGPKQRPPAPYDVEALESRAQLDALIARAKRFDARRAAKDGPPTGGLTVLLHGPPGTGKTAFARHLAMALGRPIHVLRGSDVLGPYVGQSEQQLAKAFARATKSRAVLVLDEVDGLLIDRSAANHHWETSLVNELLGQLDDFAGVLVCTTNRLDHLDPAALRRFTDKLCLSYLSSAGVLRLYAAQLDPFVTAARTSAHDARLAALDRATPGTFATVARNLALEEPMACHHAVIDRLEAELDATRRDKPKVGF